MIHSQAIALRCAAALPKRPHILKKIADTREWQLANCADDEARRLLLGKSS